MRLVSLLLVFAAMRSIDSHSNDIDTSDGRGDGMRRIVRLALFFSKTLMDSWVNKKNRPATDLTDHLQSKFLQKFNKLWAEPQLGAGIDIRFEIVKIRYLTAREEAELKNLQGNLRPARGDSAGLVAFCDWAKKKQKSGEDQWDIPAYIVDKKRQPDSLSRDAVGEARSGMKAVCGSNCLVMNGRVVHWRFEPIYANLLAHEVGHILDFQHTPAECHENIMRSPGIYSVWSECTKKKARKMFGNPWVYPCLAYQHGTMPPPTARPGRVSQEDLAVIKKTCPSGKVGSHMDFDDQHYFYANDYFKWHDVAPQWWHKENVCKWRPCRTEDGPSYYALTPLTGYRCGVNKICDNETSCVSAGNSGCGATRDMGGIKGLFSSYKYTERSHYLPNLKCAWRITVPKGQRVELSFLTMDVPGLAYCGVNQYGGDSVDVYNGRDTNASLVASLCNGILKTVKSTPNVPYVTFRSDRHDLITGKGFVAVYKSV